MSTDENKKSLNPKILIAGVLILVVVTVFLSYQYQQYKIRKELQAKEEKYQTAITLIKENKLDEALVLLNQTLGYKDTVILIKYIHINLELLSKSEFELGEGGYNKLINDLDKLYSQKMYSNTRSIIANLRDNLKVRRTNYLSNKLASQAYDNGIAYFNEGNYEKAYYEFDSCDAYVEDYKDAKERAKLCYAFKYYKNWLDKGRPLENKIDNDGKTAAYEFREMDINQFPELSKKINKAKNDLAFFINLIDKEIQEREEKEKRQKDIQVAKAQERAGYKDGNPPIGATIEECLKYYDWRNPKDINTTTTAYGTRKQYCYDGYRYLYFENGILIAIQE